MEAAIGGVTPAALPEVRRNIVKLSPTNCHPAAVCWINCDRALVSSIANDVIPICINVYLIAGEDAMRRDHSR